mmetsp:Transcript_64786/g.204567  ORF Transcript_64786/g.204567 Transcript_64786/m.204567 type:complete len:206 (+) Transcript_64786:681-1298(+)
MPHLRRPKRPAPDPTPFKYTAPQATYCLEQVRSPPLQRDFVSAGRCGAGSTREQTGSSREHPSCNPIHTRPRAPWYPPSMQASAPWEYQRRPQRGIVAEMLGSARPCRAHAVQGGSPRLKVLPPKCPSSSRTRPTASTSPWEMRARQRRGDLDSITSTSRPARASMEDGVHANGHATCPRRMRAGRLPSKRPPGGGWARRGHYLR